MNNPLFRYYVLIFASGVGFFISLFIAGIYPTDLIFWSITGLVSVFSFSLYLYALNPHDKLNYLKSVVDSLKRKKV